VSPCYICYWSGYACQWAMGRARRRAVHPFVGGVMAMYGGVETESQAPACRSHGTDHLDNLQRTQYPSSVNPRLVLPLEQQPSTRDQVRRQDLPHPRHAHRWCILLATG
jgi:hypothetical protein